MSPELEQQCMKKKIISSDAKFNEYTKIFIRYLRYYDIYDIYVNKQVIFDFWNKSSRSEM